MMIQILRKNSETRTLYEITSLIPLTKELQRFFIAQGIQGTKDMLDVCELMEYEGFYP